ncbi:unnamed protein product [Cuscuta epithymum]|uniref:Uncharacterized protein n=1 Tax=Cuscuta epithymum TaxID=186058 RepID=A0AAV0FPW2_9ASTE|nr:unnamed protein product [Cuscuta epithymum]
MAAATQKDHIEEMRRCTFSIRGLAYPPTEDNNLHAQHNLSADDELYFEEDDHLHFLMELIQIAEENEYEMGVEPSLEFVFTSEDITQTAAKATLLIFNNEKAFTRQNIESSCSVGFTGQYDHIGKKGIGFKSVFAVTSHPFIFSNGYQIRFTEEPGAQCEGRYIVPEWVGNDHPVFARIKRTYGSSASLPTTTLVLPLYSHKVNSVKRQLSNINPEFLLFLSNIRKLSVREDNAEQELNTVTTISISSEKTLVTKKSINAESYVLILSSDEDKGYKECSYHMWTQRFPVKKECGDVQRMGIDDWVITLAFPHGERLTRGNRSVGIFAFLPTKMVTNFPFVIQSDFLLSSSKDEILLDSRWNKEILDCIPVAFMSAFTSLVKANDNAPVSSLIEMFHFLPVHTSPYPRLNASVRDTIKAKLVEEDIVPCQSYTNQKIFRKPCQVGRLLPAFRKLLNKARKHRVTFHNLSIRGKYILNSAFDNEKYNGVLKFLEVEKVEPEWYFECISNHCMGRSTDLDAQLLLFVADNWGSSLFDINTGNLSLLNNFSLLSLPC